MASEKDQMIERLVTEHRPRVRAMAESVRRGKPRRITVDDLDADGLHALFVAARKWTPSHPSGADFWSYAWHRVHGAMVDHLRGGDAVYKGVYGGNGGNGGNGGSGRELLPPPASPSVVETRETVTKLLTGLEDRERSLLTYRFLRGLTRNETGKRLGIPCSYVLELEKKIVARLRERHARAEG